MKKSIFLILLVAVNIGLMGCDTDKAASSKAANTALPITLQADGNTYTITKYEVKKDEKGNTEIVFIGQGWNLVGGGPRAFRCSFTATGQVFNATAAKTYMPTSVEEEAKVGFVFDTSATPEALIIYPVSNPEKKVTINLK